MKKLVYLIPFALLFSCNQEIPEDQYHQALVDNCEKNIIKLASETDELTDEEKSDACGCLADSYVAETDTYTLNSVIQMAKDSDKMTARIDSCVTALEEPVMEQEVDTTSMEMEEEM